MLSRVADASHAFMQDFGIYVYERSIVCIDESTHEAMTV